MKRMMIGFVLLVALLTLICAHIWSAAPAAISTNVIASVNTDKISSDVVEYLIKETLSADTEVDKVADLVVEDAVLSQEATRLGLDKSPTVLDVLGKQMHHLYTVTLIKAVKPDLLMGDIDRNHEELEEKLLTKYQFPEKIKCLVDPLKSLASTAKTPSQRKSVIVAKIGTQRISLQDMLNFYPVYQEQYFIESYLADKDLTITQTSRMELMRRDFEKIAAQNPVLKEYRLRLQQNVLANAVRAYYVNPYVRFRKTEKSQEEIIFRLPKPKMEDLKQYYEMNQKKFIVADVVKVRQVMVKQPEKLDELMPKLKPRTIYHDDDIKVLVRNFSVAEDKEKDGDLGVIYNPILHPEAKLPEFLTPAVLPSSLFKLKKGEVSAPFRSELGYHVFHVYEREEKLVPFDNEWAQQTSRKLWDREQRKIQLTHLSAKAKEMYKINEDALKALRQKLGQ